MTLYFKTKWQKIAHFSYIQVRVVVSYNFNFIFCKKLLNEGNVVETGSVSEIFTAPKSPEAKSLIIGSGSTAKEMRGRHCIRIVFKENSSYEPVVGNMTLQFKTPVNILYANTKDLNGTAAGEMILQLPEDTEIAGGGRRTGRPKSRTGTAAFRVQDVQMYGIRAA